MLDTNNIIDYKINIKQKEKKYSLATVLAWLYLKTVGRILPERWNKWAKNILYYDKTNVDNGIQADAFKAADKNIQVSEFVAQRIQSEIANGDKATYQCIATQTDDLITVDQVDLKPKAAEENSETASEDEGIHSKTSDVLTDEDCSDIEMDNENAFADENYNTMEEICTEGNEQLENVNQELNLECLHNVLLKKTNIDLESQLKVSYEDLTKATEAIAYLEEEITAASEKNKQLKLQLMKYEEDYTELKDISNQIEKELSSELEEMREEIKKNLLEIRKKDTEIEALIARSKELKQDKKAMNDKNENLQIQVTTLESKLKSEISSLSCEKEALQLNVDILTAQLQSAQQQLEKEKLDLEDKLKDLSSKLSAVEMENKRLENEITKLQEQVQILEREKKELAEIDDNLKKTSLYVIEMLEEEVAKQKEQIEQLQEEAEKADIKKLEEENMEEQLKILTQQLSNNQEQQELGKELKSVDKKLEDMNKKTKEQTKTKAPDTVSRVSIAKSTTKSTLSKFLPNKLLKSESLDDFLSDQNTKLKENFPEFKKKHFCHNVLRETKKSLSNQDNGKFKSRELLKLLESNLIKSARKIIEVEVKEIVTKHYNIRNIDEKLRDGVLKDKLSISINKCMEKLKWDKKDATAITDSVLQDFRSRNNTSNDLLKEIVVKELIEGRVNFFSSNIQSLQLVSSIRDKFLSPDQKMCNRVSGEGSTYQLTPNSLISSANIISSPNIKRVATVGF